MRLPRSKKRSLCKRFYAFKKKWDWVAYDTLTGNLYDWDWMVKDGILYTKENHMFGYCICCEAKYGDPKKYFQLKFGDVEPGTRAPIMNKKGDVFVALFIRDLNKK